MPFWGNRPDEEELWVRETNNARSRAEAAAAAWAEADVSYARRIAGASPWMRPGIALALAKSHASPKAIEAAAKAEATRYAQVPNRPRGSVIKPGQLLPGHRRLLEKGPLTGDLPQPKAERERFQGITSETRRDFARASQHEGVNYPTTQATASWQADQRARALLQEQGVLDEKGRLRAPVASPGTFLNDDKQIDERKLASLDADTQSRFRQFMDVLGSVEEDIQFIDADGELNIFDPETRSFRLDPSEIETVQPFGPVTDAVGAALGQVGQALGGAAESLRLPTVGQGLRGMAGSSGGGTNRGRPAATIAAQESLATQGFQTPTNPNELIQLSGMAANAPVQEFQGMIRNAYGQATGRDVPWWEPQSDLLIMAGTDLEPGDGWLVDPDSELAAERLRREEEHGGLLNGQRVTLGRLSASAVARIGLIEPGDNAYRILSGLVDAGVQIADPTAVGAKALSRAHEARTLFAAAREVSEASARTPPPETLDDLRALAASFGVRGRGTMSREGLIQTLSSRAAEIDNMPIDDVFNLGARFNIPRRTRMAPDELRTVVRDRLASVGQPKPAGPMPGEAIEATSWGSATARGLAEGALAPLRVTGIPWLARKTGLIKGDFTSGVHGPTADAWMNGRTGTWVRERIAAVKSPTEMDRLTGHKLLPQELAMLIDTNTVDEATDVLRPLLGTRVRSTKDIWTEWMDEGALPGVKQRNWIVEKMDDSKWDQDIPHREIDLDDPRSALNNTVAWMRNAHMPDEKIDPFVDRLIRARNNNEVFDVVVDVMDDTDGWLANLGVQSPALRREATRAYRREVADAQSWFLSEMTEQKSLFDEIDVGGKSLPTGTPHDWVSAYNRFIYLPDHRVARRLSSKYPNLAWTDAGELRKIPEAARIFQEELWKPITLLRAAWPVRVIAEEQLRMGAAGYASVFKDPLSFLAFAVAREKDVHGDLYALAREFQESQVRRTNGWLTDRPGQVRTGKSQVFEKGDAGWSRAVANMVGELHLDPVTRKIAEADSLDEVEDWLVNGAGREWLDKAILDHPERFPDALPSGGVRQYIENASAWIDKVTGGNEDLLRAIRTGKVRSARSVKGRHVEWNAVGGDMAPSSHLVDLIEKRAYDAAPTTLAAPSELANIKYRGVIVERMFTWLMGKPTNYLSRSPVFKQAYWRRMGELAAHADHRAYDDLVGGKSAYTQLLEGAAARTEKLGLMKITEAPSDVIRTIKNTKPVGKLNLGELDAIAKQHALDETRRLLYDMNQRSQLMDQLRLVFPFGEAWREVITRWATDLANPATARGWNSLRRFQQTVQGARGEDFGEVVGAPEGEGFFFTDEYGEEVFVYPGSQWITQSITEALGEGVPVALAGRVEGLSMFGTVIPGIGPAASIPVAALIQDEPGWQRSVRNWLLPFGHLSERGEGASTQFLNYAPPWMRHAVAALTSGGYDQESNRIYANSILSATNYLYSTGNYDTSSAAGRARLLEDARDSGRVLTAVRMMSAFVAPSAPSLKFFTETDEGIQLTAFLRDDYYRLVDEEGYEMADEIFLSRWGNTAAMVMQAQTREVQPGIEPTQEFADWARSADAKHLKTHYDAIWAFFGPGGGEFDTQTYIQQIHGGDREALTQEQYLRLAQNHLGQMLRDRLMANWPEDPTEEDLEWRAQKEMEIVEAYPGFEDFSDSDQRPSRDKILRQIDEALQDKRVTSTPIGEALSRYWKARNAVLDSARDRGLAARDVTYELGRANSLAEDREWLFGIGERLALDYPGFDRIWNRQLRHEVEPDVED